MNFKQLEAFLAFMTAGSTIEAAQRLGTSQPAISRLLSQFEQDLGVQLFVRRKGRLHPTNEAEALLPDVQNMIADAESLHRHVNQLRLGGLRRTLIRVQLPSTVAQTVMPQVAEVFLSDFPDVALEVLVGTYETSEAAVLGREADVALVRSPPMNSGLSMVLRLATEAVCILPPDHPLLVQETISSADLIGEDLVLLGRQRSLRHQIDQVFRQVRMMPQIRAEVHSVEMACRLVARGLGVSIVNGLFAHLCRDMGIQCRPFRPQIDYYLGMATLGGQAPHPLVPELTRRILQAMLERAGAGVFQVLPLEPDEGTGSADSNAAVSVFSAAAGPRHESG
ncbi:LysR family transcriptional regulator [Achromobacter seleniivolatilans]|uniref:LysR family transcriptional regulator n=1 Tax=Achromobacter seleniivolatilans TaxID=3047478 RepID=A0ABY9M754_9BURK|nr:LysR family transcriptional regulator [Achromobacter sp. R39]WMD22838.1 LysR family transcriptional regulator [Achromobacter sp. R39]